MVRKLTAAKKVELGNQFKTFDKSGDGKLNFVEMKQLLRKGNPNLPDEELESLFTAADINGDGALDFDEFVCFVYGEKPPVVVAAPPALKEKFQEFAGDKMDSREFNKLCIDCGLIGKGFAKTQVDTTFTKVKERGTRDIDFDQFTKALNLIAEAKGVSPNEIFTAVANASKTSSGTQADAVRFHDDKSTYTGAHTFNEKHGENLGGGEYGEARHTRLTQQEAAHTGGSDADWSGVEAVYRLYDKDNNGLDNREFDKILTDCGLFNKHFKKNDSAIVFNKALSKGKRKITVEEFKEALRKIADKRMSSTAEVQQLVAKSEGPILSGTKADAVRFHDDKSTYTGAHVFNENHGAEQGEMEEARHNRLKDQAGQHDVGPEGPWDGVKAAFDLYEPKGEMESREFKKIMEDCGVIDKAFPLTHLDSVFAACKSGKKITFEGFQEALRRIAGKKSMQLRELQDIIAKSEGPIRNATKADAVRFHDDKSTYTGAHVYNEMHGVGEAGESEEARHNRIKAEAGTFDVGPEGPWNSVEAAFNLFESTGKGEMESRDFKKIMEDCDVIDKSFPLTHLDSVFAACKSGKKITFEGFQEALRRIAKAKSMQISELQRQIGSTQGPTRNATEAEAVRFHDDKSTYTGAHAGK